VNDESTDEVFFTVFFSFFGGVGVLVKSDEVMEIMSTVIKAVMGCKSQF